RKQHWRVIRSAVRACRRAFAHPVARWRTATISRPAASCGTHNSSPQQRWSFGLVRISGHDRRTSTCCALTSPAPRGCASSRFPTRLISCIAIDRSEAAPGLSTKSFVSSRARERQPVVRMMTYVIKAAVADPAGKVFEFVAQKTMYGGKHIAEGDTVYIFASENEGGPGLI